MDPAENGGISQSAASARALYAFKVVLENADKIELDHYVLYHARGSIYLLLSLVLKSVEQITSLEACTPVWETK